MSDAKKYNVLVVDDEQPILDLIADVLDEAGLSVKVTDSPLEALRLAKLYSYDALVLDVYMPELPGMLLHAKLKFIDPELAKRTLFISGHFTREELRADLEKSASFLPKPFQPAGLVDKVRKLLPAKPRQLGSCLRCTVGYGQPKNEDLTP
jgi:DNA-binding response OmpR family regulator